MTTEDVEEKKESPKKIKLVISNLHLGKGRFLENGGMNPLEEFYFNEKFVEYINYYSSGIYKDYEVELIINGDFINFLQVDYKGHFLAVLTESVSLELLKKVVKGHKNVFDALAAFAIKENKTITYIIGNEDQAMLWPSCKIYLNQVVGSPIRFKNIMHYFDGFHVEHGHMYDAINRVDPKKFFLKKNLPEPILNLPIGSHFFIELVLKIKLKYPFIDKIRPFKKLVTWTMFNHTKLFFSSIFATIQFIVSNFFFKKNPRKNFSLKTLSRMVIQSALFPDLSVSARRLLKNERIHTVIFGQSQGYKYRQWEMDKEFFNVGTWTEITSLDISSLGRVSKLTYVLIEYPTDESRPRARLKEWHGFYRIEEDVVIS
ncbi:MAG: hypothetical protein JNL11_15265 [Bdellovibrionaceae bacterium]|nr:hypothetical protein [Pseudobdellovibrionaceae bacterium]